MLWQKTLCGLLSSIPKLSNSHRSGAEYSHCVPVTWICRAQNRRAGGGLNQRHSAWSCSGFKAPLSFGVCCPKFRCTKETIRLTWISNLFRNVLVLVFGKCWRKWSWMKHCCGTKGKKLKEITDGYLNFRNLKTAEWFSAFQRRIRIKLKRLQFSDGQPAHDHDLKPPVSYLLSKLRHHTRHGCIHGESVSDALQFETISWIHQSTYRKLIC